MTYIDKYNYNVISLSHRKNLSNSHVGRRSRVSKSVTNKNKQNDNDIKSLLLRTSNSGNINNSGQDTSTSSNVPSIQHYTRRNNRRIEEVETEFELRVILDNSVESQTGKIQ